MLDNDWIDAYCIVFPNGETRWILADKDNFVKEVDNWKTDHPEFEGTQATLGAVQIRMRNSDYLKTIT